MDFREQRGPGHWKWQSGIEQIYWLVEMCEDSGGSALRIVAACFRFRSWERNGFGARSFANFGLFSQREGERETKSVSQKEGIFKSN